MVEEEDEGVEEEVFSSRVTEDVDVEKGEAMALLTLLPRCDAGHHVMGRRRWRVAVLMKHCILSIGLPSSDV